MFEINPQKGLKNKDFSFFKAAERILAFFPVRAQQIIADRYGLSGSGRMTLEEIGKRNKVTRERVRQIIREAIKKIANQKESAEWKESQAKILFTIEAKSGIISEEALLENLGEANLKERGAISFCLDFLSGVKYLKVPGEIVSAVATARFNLTEWQESIGKVEKLLLEKKIPLSEKQLLAEYSQRGGTLGGEKLLSYLAVSEKIRKNKFEKWGIAEWREISPKGTREKAYLVLKESDKPLYFREIAALIDKFQLNRKKTNPQTVHNELIKDKRFVLVGRGIYALAEWGYKSGTVKELLEDILTKNEKPMPKEEVLKRILQMRQVKRSTVVINLNNFFQRVGKDGYSLKS